MLDANAYNDIATSCLDELCYVMECVMKALHFCIALRSVETSGYNMNI